jgi:hypothetical protein
MKTTSNPADHQNSAMALEIDHDPFDFELNKGQSAKEVGLLDDPIPEEPKSKNNYYYAVILWTISQASYAIMVAFSKITFKINPAVTPYDLGLMRAVVQLPFYVAYAVYYKVNLVDFKGRGPL